MPKQPQEVPFSKAEDSQRVGDDVDLTCQASRLITHATPYSPPNRIAPKFQPHLPTDSINQPSPNSNLSTGMPTAQYFPASRQNVQGPSHLVVADGVGIKPQWSAEHPSMFSCWYDQSELRSCYPFRPSTWLPYHACQHSTGAPLLQLPHFHYILWYPALPLVNISQSTLATPHSEVPLTSSDGVAPRVWGLSTPVHPIPAPNSGSMPSLRVPLPTTSASGPLSALFSSPHGSDGLSMGNSPALQLSADSAFGHVRQEPQETTHLQEQPTRSSCMLVTQNPRMQPFSHEFVAREQQLRAPPTEKDQWGGRPKLPGHLCPVEHDFSALGQSEGSAVCTTSDQAMGYIWNSLKTGQHSGQTNTPGTQKISSDFSSSGQHTLGLPAQGRNTLPRHSGKGHWGIADDRLLIKLVNTYGTRRWSLIATFMSNRLGKQCRERWVNHLQPNIKKEDWTPEEEQLLVRAHATFGNRWSAIAKMLPGRTDNSIKNHWHAAVRKKGRHGPYRPSHLRDYIQRTTEAMCGAQPQNRASSVGLLASVGDESVPQNTVNHQYATR